MLDTSFIELTKLDKIKNLHLPSKITPDLAYLSGVLAGDGSIHIQYDKHNYLIKCVGNPKDEKEFYDIVLTNLFIDLFGIKIETKMFDSGTTYGFQLSSKSLVMFFTKSIGLPLGRKDNIEVPELFRNDTKLMKPFIQGFFDTDGCLALKKRYKNYQYYPVVSCVSKSKFIIDQMFEFLQTTGLEAKQYRRQVYDLRINKKEITYDITMYGHLQLVKWMNCIGFRHPKHLHKFELWKERNENNKRANKALNMIAEDGVSLDKKSRPNLNSTIRN